MEVKPDLYEVAANTFINYCKDKFKWSDLSKDVIMDVGCGKDGFCGKAILARFPNVEAVIGIDYNMEVVSNFGQKNKSKMKCQLADLLNRSTLQKYEGNMSKVVSTYVFHQLVEKKEEAFRNVYRLLKPGGEAAILFVIQSSIYEWLTEILKIQKWKNYYKGKYVKDMYIRGFGLDHYKKMVGKIGFHVLDGKEDDIKNPYLTDHDCKEALYKMCGANFKLPTELIEEFKEACLQVLLKVCERDEEGRPCYTSTELSLLLTKPESASGSKTNENPGS